MISAPSLSPRSVLLMLPDRALKNVSFITSSLAQQSPMTPAALRIRINFLITTCTCRLMAEPCLLISYYSHSHSLC